MSLDNTKVNMCIRQFIQMVFYMKSKIKERFITIRRLKKMKITIRNTTSIFFDVCFIVFKIKIKL